MSKKTTKKETTIKTDTPVKNKIGELEREPSTPKEAPKVVEPQVGVKHIVPEKVEGYKITPKTLIQTVYTKAAFQKLMDVYKKQNPKKYAWKEGELKRKLSKIRK